MTAPLDRVLDHLKQCADRDMPAALTPESARQILAELGSRRQWQLNHQHAAPVTVSAYLAVRALAKAELLHPTKSSDEALPILEGCFAEHDSKRETGGTPAKPAGKAGGGK